MGIEVSVDIDAPLDDVWREAADLESHAEWMADAESITFKGERRRGVGTVMEVLTRVGPLKTTDVIEVTEWLEPAVIGVRHRGIVTGTGRFVLEALDERRTRFTWREELNLPWFFGGSLGRPVSERVLSAIWRGNLRRLKERIEGAG